MDFLGLEQAKARVKVNKRNSTRIMKQDTYKEIIRRVDMLKNHTPSLWHNNANIRQCGI